MGTIVVGGGNKELPLGRELIQVDIRAINYIRVVFPKWGQAVHNN